MLQTTLRSTSTPSTIGQRLGLFIHLSDAPSQRCNQWKRRTETTTNRSQIRISRKGAVDSTAGSNAFYSSHSGNSGTNVINLFLRVSQRSTWPYGGLLATDEHIPRTTWPTALVPGGRVVQNLVQILLIRRSLASGIWYQFHLLNMVALLKLCVECPVQLCLPVTKSTLFMRTLPPQTGVLLEKLARSRLRRSLQRSLTGHVPSPYFASTRQSSVG